LLASAAGPCPPSCTPPPHPAARPPACAPQDRSQPIWVSLSRGQVELHRDIQTVFAGSAAPLEQHLGPGQPLWGRQYLFWHNGRPLTLIHEVFSRRLERYLGPLGGG
jgi:chorismate--pyruvate lyase